MAAGAVLALAMMLGTVGNNRVPLELHEVYVVQTAEEMHERGDWVVPYCGGRMRLNKPPLSYWLTGAVAAIDGADELEPWHGRIVSAVGGVILVAMTMWTAAQLFSAPVGLMAGLLCATSYGFFTWTHNARSDMLYAAICAAMIGLWVMSWKAKGRGRRALIGTYGLWVMFGLGTLCKGPHIPAIFVGAFGLVMAMHAPSRPLVWKVLRPATGLIVAMAIALPWWAMLYWRIGDRLFESQLAGSRYELGIWQVVDPYYFYRAWQHVLPWVALWPAGLAAVFTRRRINFAARAMGVIILIGLIVLSFGGGKRWLYALPLLGPLCVVMAFAGRRMLTQFYGSGVLRPGVLLSGHAIAAAAALAGMWWMHQQGGDVSTLDSAKVIAGLLIMAVSVGAAWMWAKQERDWRMGRAEMVGAALVFAVMFQAGGSSAVLWSESRWGPVRMGRIIDERIDPATPVLTVGADAWGLVYYADRPVREVESLDELTAAADQAGDRGLAVVVRSERLEQVIEAVQGHAVQQVATVEHAAADKDWILLRVR